MAKIISASDPSSISVEIEGRGGKVKLEQSFWEFLLGALRQYEPAGKGFENIERAMLISGKLRTAQKDNVTSLTLEEEEFRFLDAAVQIAAWVPEAAWAFIPFYKQMKADKVQTVDLSTKK